VLSCPPAATWKNALFHSISLQFFRCPTHMDRGEVRNPVLLPPNPEALILGISHTLPTWFLNGNGVCAPQSMSEWSDSPQVQWFDLSLPAPAWSLHFGLPPSFTPFPSVVVGCLAMAARARMPGSASHQPHTTPSHSDVPGCDRFNGQNRARQRGEGLLLLHGRPRYSKCRR
jgi:hypothetical protein